jgi:phosphoserine aminotransferase
MDFAVMAENGSMLNTPPTFGIYLAGLTQAPLAQGGVAAVEAANIAKAKRLYDIDGSGGFYRTRWRRPAARA